MPKLAYRKPNGKSGDQYSLTLPKEFVMKMGINPEDREIIATFNPETKEFSVRKQKRVE